MRTTISKRFTFEAAHQLPNHDGHCRNLHGHSYAVEVGVTGPIRTTPDAPDEGMVVDFGVVKAIFNDRIHAKCDHAYLNDVLPFLTTAENLSRWILAEMNIGLADSPDVNVAFVRVWETATSCAETTWD